MSWQLMRDNYAAIGCSGDNEALFDTIIEYSDYVIPMHEMNVTTITLDQSPGGYQDFDQGAAKKICHRPPIITLGVDSFFRGAMCWWWSMRLDG